MDIQLKKGILELVILKFLSSRDYYGYELNKDINEILQLNESTVYALLKKLIEKNLCIQYIKNSDNGPSRKYYQITTLGMQHLKNLEQEWIEFNMKISVLLGGEYYE
ncbi:PadR family transcriptional regulator [Williamsoniiplasma somnilux]|uniref:PadR family transcriptional regulator n=1 Tax=Williamsoniiplasma somnilux TaxID=215578 RepID=A0A2K8NYS4_9MOLU|nr:PadR family transcriptional regulator [Williamsoniiplasma somnilux]ATZ18962.1 PadR family transcriptional regulator [Williamsoniiplasma somnilux]